MAGGRTSVSAPLDVPPRVTAAMGHPTTWIGNPDVRPSRDIVRMEPEKGWRGGGPLCPLRWVFLRDHPHRWAAQPNGSGIPMCVPPKTSSERNRRQGGGGAQRGLGCMRFGCPSERFLSDPNPAERTQRSAPPRPAVRSLATGGFGCGRSGDTDACSFGCPSGRWPSDARPAERTQRSAPPRPAGWHLAMVVFGGGSSGFFDSGVWVAHRNGFSPIQTQRSGHRGPPPRDPLCGPWPRGALGVGPAGISIHAARRPCGTISVEILNSPVGSGR